MRGKTIPLLMGKVADEVTDRNFRHIADTLAKLSAHVAGQETGQISLSTGDNYVVPPNGMRPRSRITAYQDAPATIHDGGLQADGRWKVTASSPCRVRFIFY